ncbi:MAG: hypothetical protein WDN28_22250 [Chthoniobacter sp.]
MKTTTTTSPTTRRPAGARRTAAPWRKYLPHAIGAALVLLLINALRPQPLAVEIGTVKHGPLTVTVLEEGKTRIRHRFTISPPVPGYLNRVPLRQGDRNRGGQDRAGHDPAAARDLPRSPRARRGRSPGAGLGSHEDAARNADRSRHPPPSTSPTRNSCGPRT